MGEGEGAMIGLLVSKRQAIEDVCSRFGVHDSKYLARRYAKISSRGRAIWTCSWNSNHAEIDDIH